MTKARQRNKEAKKQPNLTFKEKRAVRKAKKNTRESIQPLLSR